MRALMLLVGLLGVVACGGDDGEGGDVLTGVWAWENPNNRSCGIGYAFKGGLRYQRSTLCQASDGVFRSETVAGEYDLKNGKITFSPMVASCANKSPEPFDISYKMLSGPRLQLSDLTGVIVLERVKSDGNDDATPAVIYGCFDDEGAFVERAVQDI